MKIGYTRVSMEDQHPESQIELLKKAGCEAENIYTDVASGGVWNRPQLHEALEKLRPGDTLIFWKIDRLSRSLSDLLKILEKVDKSGATFKSLTEPLDTSDPIGKMHMQIIGVFAEFERGMIRERTKVGLARARANGRIGGGRFILSPAMQTEVVRQVRSGEKTQSDVAREMHISKATVSRIVSKVRIKEQKKMGLV